MEMARANKFLYGLTVALPFFLFGLNELKQAFDGFFFGNVLLDALLSSVERYLATSCSDVTVIGVSHFAGTIDNAAHNANLQTNQVAGSGFYARDGFLQVVQRSATARARDVFRLGEFDAGSLKDGVSEGDELFAGECNATL